MEVEEGEGKSDTADRFSPWKEGVTPSQLWKMNHTFSIKSSHRFSGKLVIEDTIEMTILFGSLAYSGGISVNRFGD